MNRLKNLALAALVFAIASLIFVVATPKALHAVVATLVQVTNTAANPIPVVQTPATTTLIGSLSTTSCDGCFIAAGSFDVSRYSSIRFYGDPSAAGSVEARFILSSVDASGIEYRLDTLTATDTSTVTGVYATPGATLKISVITQCTRSPCPSSIPVNFAIYGR